MLVTLLDEQPCMPSSPLPPRPGPLLAVAQASGAARQSCELQVKVRRPSWCSNQGRQATRP